LRPSALDQMDLIKKPCSLQNGGCGQRATRASETAPSNSHLVGRLQPKPSIKLTSRLSRTGENEGWSTK
jgi:hypothetical protein